MTDRYPGTSPGLNSPAIGAAAITKSDTTEIEVTRAIWVGGAGDIKVTMADGSVAVLVGVPAGTLLPIRVKLVWSTSTTATSMCALY